MTEPTVVEISDEERFRVWLTASRENVFQVVEENLPEALREIYRQTYKRELQRPGEVCTFVWLPGRSKVVHVNDGHVTYCGLPIAYDQPSRAPSFPRTELPEIMPAICARCRASYIARRTEYYAEVARLEQL